MSVYDRKIESKKPNKNQALLIMLANSLPVARLFTRSEMIVNRSVLVELEGPGGALVVVLAAFLVVLARDVALVLGEF